MNSIFYRSFLLLLAGNIISLAIQYNSLFSNGNTPAQKTKVLNIQDCTFNGHKLYGKIQIVNSFPDVKVKVVDAFPDLKVKVVNAFPDDCGEWQFVDAFPDTKIQFVESFPDVTIQFVDAFPGMN